MILDAFWYFRKIWILQKTVTSNCGWCTKILRLPFFIFNKIVILVVRPPPSLTSMCRFTFSHRCKNINSVNPLHVWCIYSPKPFYLARMTKKKLFQDWTSNSLYSFTIPCSLQLGGKNGEMSHIEIYSQEN